MQANDGRKKHIKKLWWGLWQQKLLPKWNKNKRMPSNDFNNWSFQTKIIKQFKKRQMYLTTTSTVHSERCKIHILQW